MENKPKPVNLVMLRGEVIRIRDKRSEKAPTEFTVKTVEVLPEDRRDTNFHDVKFFGELTAAVGDKVEVFGKMRSGSYERDGNKVYTYELMANKVEVTEKADYAPTPEEVEDVDLNSIPF